MCCQDRVVERKWLHIVADLSGLVDWTGKLFAPNASLLQFCQAGIASWCVKPQGAKFFIYRKVCMINHLFLKTVIVTGVLAATTQFSFAADTFSAEVATGNKSQVYRLGAQWSMNQAFLRSADSEVWGYWDATIANWRENKYENVTGAKKDFIDIGITPTLRWQALNHQGGYLEAGLGPHLNSGVYNNNGRRLSTHLQFGSHLGVGYVMDCGLDLALKVQHFSNGAIKKPNNGVNLAIVKVGYKF